MGALLGTNPEHLEVRACLKLHSLRSLTAARSHDKRFHKQSQTPKAENDADKITVVQASLLTQSQ